MTQAVLGRAIDISPRMISFYESGNHFPRDEIILKRIADLFEVSLDYLMGYSDLREEDSLKMLCNTYRSLSSAHRSTVMDFMGFLAEKNSSGNGNALDGERTRRQVRPFCCLFAGCLV